MNGEYYWQQKQQQDERKSYRKPEKTSIVKANRIYCSNYRNLNFVVCQFLSGLRDDFPRIIVIIPNCRDTEIE